SSGSMATDNLLSPHIAAVAVASSFLPSYSPFIVCRTVVTQRSMHPSLSIFYFNIFLINEKSINSITKTQSDVRFFPFFRSIKLRRAFYFPLVPSPHPQSNYYYPLALINQTESAKE